MRKVGQVSEGISFPGHPEQDYSAKEVPQLHPRGILFLVMFDRNYMPTCDSFKDV